MFVYKEKEGVRKVVNPDATLILNVRGCKFEIFWATLQRIPELEETIRTRGLLRKSQREYYFDRDPDVFKCLLNYCRLGELHVPNTVCGPVFTKELHAWGINRVDNIEYCCLTGINNSLMRIRNMKKFDDMFDDHGVEMKTDAGAFDRLRHFVWNVLDHPKSSPMALIYAIVMYLTVIGSLLVFITDSVDHPAFRTSFTDADYEIKNGWSKENIQQMRSWPNASAVFNANKRTNQMNGIFIATNTFLTFDIVARTIFCPHFCTFIINPYTVIDILSLVPFYYNLIETVTQSKGPINVFFFSQTNNLIRLLSISIGLRCFRILRHYKGLQVLLYTIKVSAYDLLLMLIFVSIATILFSTLMFYAESGTNPKFTNIPRAFWWCVITITTTGYGDMVPITLFGYVIASFCTLCGVLLIAFTVPIVVNNFLLYYTHATQNKNDGLYEYARQQIEDHLKDAVCQVKKLTEFYPKKFLKNESNNIVLDGNCHSYTLDSGSQFSSSGTLDVSKNRPETTMVKF